MSKNSYSKVGGENVRLLQALIDEAPSYTKPTNSRNANILKSIINNTEYNEPPQSEIEELLIALKAKIGGEIEVNELTVTENGSYDAGLNKAYNPVNVELPLDSKEITANGTYNASDDNLAGFSQVTVNVEGYKLKDIPNTPTAIATFSDGANLPMPKLEVGIEPVQDLHGYDAPWVGGAGKNKLNLDFTNDTDSFSGLTFSHTDSTFKLKGTVSEPSYRIFNLTLPPNIDLNTDYTLSAIVTGTVASCLVSVYFYRDNTETDFIRTDISNTTPKTTKQFSVAYNNATFVLEGLQSGDYFDCEVKLQLEKGDSATQFEPYSNICPIIGWDEVNVVRTGKNLIDVSKLAQQVVTSQGDLRPGVPVKLQAGTYTISAQSGSLPFYITRPANNYSYISINALPFTFSLDNEEEVIARIAQSDISSWGYVNLQLEEGTTATTYEPYNGTTYTIDLDGTRYGGKVDLVSGVMTVDRVGVTVDENSNVISGSGGLPFRIDLLTGAKASSSASALTGVKCNFLKEVTQSSSWGVDGTFSRVTTDTKIVYFKVNSEITTTQQLKTFLQNNNLQFVYELATPLTIQLPTTVVKSLEGVNNVWADSGDVLGGKYFAEL